MKQLCLIIVLIFLVPSAYGLTLKKPLASTTLQKKKINITTIRTVKKVEKQVDQVQKGIDKQVAQVQKAVDKQVANIQKNIRIPKIGNNAVSKTTALTKGFQKPVAPSLTKGTALLTKELGKVDRNKLLDAPIILKSPIKQKPALSKNIANNKGLTVAKAKTANVQKGLKNTPKVPKIAFVLPVPPVAKKITLPAPLARR